MDKVKARGMAIGLSGGTLGITLVGIIVNLVPGYREMPPGQTMLVNFSALLAVSLVMGPLWWYYFRWIDEREKRRKELSGLDKGKDGRES